MSTLKCILGHNIDSKEAEHCNFCRSERARLKLMIESGAINRLDKQYRLTLHLTWKKRLLGRKIMKLTLDGRSTYYDVIDALEKADGSGRYDYTLTPQWKKHENIFNLPYLLCEYENTDLHFDVSRSISSGVLYGCPVASDIKVAEKSERPVRIIRFDSEDVIKEE